MIPDLVGKVPLLSDRNRGLWKQQIQLFYAKWDWLYFLLRTKQNLRSNLITAPRTQIADCFDVARANEFWRTSQRQLDGKCIKKLYLKVPPLKASEELLRAFFLLIVSPSLWPPPTAISHHFFLLISHHLPRLTVSSNVFCIDLWACGLPVCVTADPRKGSSPITPAMPNEISSPSDPQPDEKFVPRTFSVLHKLHVKCVFFFFYLFPVLGQCGETDMLYVDFPNFWDIWHVNLW